MPLTFDDLCCVQIGVFDFICFVIVVIDVAKGVEEQTEKLVEVCTMRKIPIIVFINKLEFSETSVETKDINKYFISVLVFILSLFILSSLMTISGINLEISFKLSILTLMNTVNSSMYGLKEFNFDELQYFAKYFLIIFMIIGRVELLTLLIIIKKFLFKN